MKVFIQGQLIDADNETVMLVFANDAELKKHVDNMGVMLDRFPGESENNKRIYTVFPDSYSEQQRQEISLKMDELAI